MYIKIKTQPMKAAANSISLEYRYSTVNILTSRG